MVVMSNVPRDDAGAARGTSTCSCTGDIKAGVQYEDDPVAVLN